jgi:GT2 family glycosyltransferase
MDGGRLSPEDPDTVTVIVVVTFDRPHLDRLWQDLASQTYRPLEVVVVDNDSHDGSVDFVRSHPLPFPIRLVHKARNQGVSPAWNMALKEVQGPWVLLISPDCTFPPNLVSRLVERAHERTGAVPVGEAIGGVSPTFLWQGRPGAPLHGSPHFHPKQRGLFNGVAPDGEILSYHGACALLSTGLLRRLGGWDEFVNFGGDEVDMGLQAQLLGYRFYTVGDLTVEHPYAPRFAGKKGAQLRMRSDSIWFSHLKHGGITLGWRTVAFEMITHLFWNQFARSPRVLASQLVWFLRISPVLAERRRGLKALWRARVRG